MKQVRNVLLAVAACMFAAQSAYPQWSTDPIVNTPVCTSTGVQQLPQTVSDGGGGAIIAWQDYRNGDFDIYAQRLDSLGYPLWTVNGVAISAAASSQVNLTAVSDGAGGAIITWEDVRSGDFDIYAQRVSGAGTPLWTTDGVVISAAANEQRRPEIASDGAGGAVITWYDIRSGTNYDIYAQRVNAAGAVQWTANGVAVCVDGAGQSFPEITATGPGSVVIAWPDSRAGNNDIYAQKVNAAGLAQWTANGVAVCTAVNIQQWPQLMSDGSGGALVTWEDLRYGTFDIFAQRIDSAGVPAWAVNGRPVSVATGDQRIPMIVTDGSGGAIITWVDYRYGGYGDIYAQRISPGGFWTWANDGNAVCTGTYYKSTPLLAEDGTGGAVITWWDDRNGFYYHIAAQRVLGSGAMKWTPNGVLLSAAANVSFQASLIRRGTGGAIVAFYDNRSGTGDIYAQNVDEFGNFGLNHPVLSSVTDVPGDQGGKVTVTWNAADIDAFPNETISSYSVWRGVDPSAVPAIAGVGVSAAASGGPTAGRFRTIVTSSGTTAWEMVGSVPAHYFDTYSYTAATTSDSSGSGTPYFSFLVSAETDDPYVFYDSNVDSGYSADNLSPGMVPSIAAETGPGPSVTVHWGPAAGAPDLKLYELHRSVTSGFTPTPGTKIGETPDTALVDGSPVAGSVNYYRVVTVDVHDNRSAPSAEAPAAVGSTQLYAVADKWNMLSIPLLLGDYTKTAVYPTAISPAFGYSGGYVAEATLANGPAYWVKFSGAQTVSMTGVGLTAEDIPVSDGWNMVGSIVTSVDAAAVTSTPPGMVTSGFYAYDNGYQGSATIEPGKGYWVKVTGAGTLHLAAAAGAVSQAGGAQVSTPDIPARIRIRDTGEMPPPPPEGLLGVPEGYVLEQNYPNPFNPVTEIGYAVRAAGAVRLAVYNMLGEEVAVLVDGVEAAGWKSVRFDAAGLPSGVYTYRLEVNGFSQSRRMLLVR